MKQTFSLEINCPAIEKESFSRFSDNVLQGVLLTGMKDFFKKELMNGLELSIVEQTCGTPDESMKKAFSLLEDACEHLSNSTEKYGINLSYRIEEYIRENTRGRTI